MVEAMVGNKREWKFVASFCEIVISQEAAEGEREEDADTR
jgi:hypothetical protein